MADVREEAGFRLKLAPCSGCSDAPPPFSGLDVTESLRFPSPASFGITKRKVDSCQARRWME